MFIRRIFVVGMIKYESPFINCLFNSEKKSAKIIGLNEWDYSYLDDGTKDETEDSEITNINCRNCYNKKFCLKNKIDDCEFLKIPESYNEKEQKRYNLTFLNKVKTLQSLHNLFLVNLSIDQDVKYGEKILYDYDSKGSTKFFSNKNKITLLNLYRYMKIPKKTYGEFREVVTFNNQIIKTITYDALNALKTLYVPHSNVLAIDKGTTSSIDILRNCKTIFALDISNFFNSINRKKVREMLDKYDLQDELKNILSMVVAPAISTDSGIKRRVWAGLCTSTLVSAMVFDETYLEIKEYCDNNNINFCVYVDDLGFGTKEKLSNEELTIHVKALIDIIKKRFFVNYKKIRCLSGSKRFFLGINFEKINPSKKFRDNLRAAINNEYKLKLEEKTKEEELIRSGRRVFNIYMENSESRSKIKGRLAYLKYINEETYKKIIEKYKKELEYLCL